MSSKTFYTIHLKRIADIFCALLCIVAFWWFFLIIALLVKIKLGSPIIFKQYRPGLDEKIFPLYKFRTMTDEHDKSGNLLPDSDRLTPFGKFLRNASLDELPEIFNILIGDMSVVGPRPQLVRDMVFMSKDERKRHNVRPGLTGLAQVSGRNAIKWEDKLSYDLKYIKKITLLNDLKIIWLTVTTALIKQEGISAENMATAEDLGDYLLRNRKVSQSGYNQLQQEAKLLLDAINKGI